MQIERSAKVLLGLAISAAMTMSGCGESKDGAMVEMSPEVQKKTDDMLTNMHKAMQEKHQAGKAAKKSQ